MMLCLRQCAVVEQGGERCGAPPRVDDESEPSTDDEAAEWRSSSRHAPPTKQRSGAMIRVGGSVRTASTDTTRPSAMIAGTPHSVSSSSEAQDEPLSSSSKPPAPAKLVKPPTPYDDVRDFRLRLLLKRQARALPVAEDELRHHGRKTGHWSWWAFPTEKPGSAEPTPKTAITVETAPELVRRAPVEWRRVLELIVDLVESAGEIGDVLPPIDHGRIVYFIKFWRDHDDTPIWLHRVINRLHGFLQSPMPVSGKKALAARPASAGSAGGLRILGPATTDQCPQRPW